MPSRNPFLNRRVTPFKCRILPVPSVRRLRDFDDQLTVESRSDKAKLDAEATSLGVRILRGVPSPVHPPSHRRYRPPKSQNQKQLTSPHLRRRVPATRAHLLLKVEANLATPPACGVGLAVALTKTGRTLRLQGAVVKRASMGQGHKEVRLWRRELAAPVSGGGWSGAQ